MTDHYIFSHPNSWPSSTRIRHEGDSGIVLTRSYEEGSENYLSASHAGHSFASSFDKMAMRDTLGFGEVSRKVVWVKKAAFRDEGEGCM